MWRAWQRNPLSTADDVRGKDFPRRRRGYSCREVDKYLSHVAEVIDAATLGLPAPESPELSRRPHGGRLFAMSLRGYDPEAVHEFVDALADRAAAAGVRILPDLPAAQPRRDRAAR